VGIFGLSRSFIDNFFLLRLRDGRDIFDPFSDFPFATNNIRPTQGGAAAAARRRHGLEVEVEWLLKDLVVIFVFLGVLCTVQCLFAKKILIYLKHFIILHEGCCF
jgi:hypothetical protein